MRKNKIIFAFLMICLGWLININVYANSQNDPVGLLRYIADNMIAGLKANKATLKSKPGIVYRLSYQYVVPYADLAEMAKRVLPPQVWNHATGAERAQFAKEFTTTVVRTYASGLTSYQDQTVRFYPVRGGIGGAKTVEVSSEITGSQNQPIHVTYRMIRTPKGWRLYDMAVEGVGMLESFRAQFADILSQGDMKHLLLRLASHNQR